MEDNSLHLEMTQKDVDLDEDSGIPHYLEIYLRDTCPDKDSALPFGIYGGEDDDSGIPNCHHLDSSSDKDSPIAFGIYGGDD